MSSLYTDTAGYVPPVLNKAIEAFVPDFAEIAPEFDVDAIDANEVEATLHGFTVSDRLDGVNVPELSLFERNALDFERAMAVAGPGVNEVLAFRQSMIVQGVNTSDLAALPEAASLSEDALAVLSVVTLAVTALTAAKQAAVTQEALEAVVVAKSNWAAHFERLGIPVGGFGYAPYRGGRVATVLDFDLNRVDSGAKLAERAKQLKARQRREAQAARQAQKAEERKLQAEARAKARAAEARKARLARQAKAEAEAKAAAKALWLKGYAEARAKAEAKAQAKKAEALAKKAAKAQSSTTPVIETAPAQADRVAKPNRRGGRGRGRKPASANVTPNINTNPVSTPVASEGSTPRNKRTRRGGRNRNRNVVPASAS